MSDNTPAHIIKLTFQDYFLAKLLCFASPDHWLSLLNIVIFPKIYSVPKWIIVVFSSLKFGFRLCCVGDILLPPEGDTFVAKPGENVTIKWSYRNAGTVFRFWLFESSDGGSAELLASISRNGDPVIEKNISLAGVEIEKPATLVLRNVNLRYNGTYTFSLAALIGGMSRVTLFVAGKLIFFSFW